MQQIFNAQIALSERPRPEKWVKWAAFWLLVATAFFFISPDTLSKLHHSLGSAHDNHFSVGFYFVAVLFCLWQAHMRNLDKFSLFELGDKGVRLKISKTWADYDQEIFVPWNKALAIYLHWLNQQHYITFQFQCDSPETFGFSKKQMGTNWWSVKRSPGANSWARVPVSCFDLDHEKAMSEIDAHIENNFEMAGLIGEALSRDALTKERLDEKRLIDEGEKIIGDQWRNKV